jgi:metal-responsive CopG/Arc/MetJ family transcriptional regulator
MAEETRCRQVSLTLPVWLLQEIDKRRGLTKRSTFIAAILSQVLRVEEKASETPEETAPAPSGGGAPAEVKPHD